MGIIRLALEIIANITSFFDRESAADEKIKDTAVKTSKNTKRAIACARQIFDGSKGFKGLDILLKDKLEEKDYEMYLKLRRRFNKYS